MPLYALIEALERAVNPFPMCLYIFALIDAYRRDLRP